jgi:hypothetical protein
MLMQRAAGHYHLHDLLWGYARARAANELDIHDDRLNRLILSA